MKKAKIDELRLISANTKVWSTDLQAVILLDNDMIIKVKHTCYGSDYVFVQPCNLCGELTIPDVYKRHCNELGLSYADTRPYKLPKPFPCWISGFNAYIR